MTMLAWLKLLRPPVLASCRLRVLRKAFTHRHSGCSCGKRRCQASRVSTAAGPLLLPMEMSQQTGGALRSPACTLTLI